MITLKACTNQRAFALLFAIIVSILNGCNSSPTVPLPPPEAIEVTAPDEDGIVWVIGESEFGLGDIATVFNEDSEIGAMSAINSDGTFEVEIEADIGDTLIVQFLHEGELFGEIEKIVPSD